MLKRGRWVAVLLLCLAGATLSGLLLLEHHGEGLGAVRAACGEGGGCEIVSRSPYAQIGGLSLAGVGLLFYLSLALLLALGATAETAVGVATARVGAAAFALALLLDLVLFALQAFVIHAFCRLCLATYLVNVAALVALWPFRSSGVRGALAAPGARPVLGGWLLGSLALASAILTGDALLSHREERRAATLLGDPTQTAAATFAAPAPAAAEPAKGPATAADATRYQEEARQAREQARKLQETLDDPNKLQQYLNDKAAREYDTAPVQELDMTSPPAEGPASAPIRVVEFSDFLCPWCKNLASALAGYLPQSGNRVSVRFKNYPLDSTCNENLPKTVHAGACWLALGGVCAQQQGKFWPYHDKVFGSTPKDPQKADVVKLAGEAGLDAAALEVCLTSDKTKDRVAADIREGKRVGVAATPTLFVNGKKLANLNQFLMAVDKEAARLHLPPLPSPQPN